MVSVILATVRVEYVVKLYGTVTTCLSRNQAFGNVNMKNVTSGSKQESTLSNTVITKSVYFVPKERC